MNLVGIVLPMYNQSEYVNICLDSIVKAQNSTAYHVFVLDDVSTDSDSEKTKRFCNYLKEDLSKDITFIRNDYNLGFSGNVNKGIKLILNDKRFTHICILNSDTIVTDYWLDDLVTNAHGALVGPVSNSVGNEQIVKTDYKILGPNGYTLQNVRNFASSWRGNHLNNIIETSMLGFFCVLGAIDLFEKVGPFDENFKTGYYEDDDYCLRCIQAGYKLKIIRQSFVHHFGSISFGALPHGTISELFKKNKEYFIKKHNIEPVDHSKAWIKSIALELQWANRQIKGIEEQTLLLEKQLQTVAAPLQSRRLILSQLVLEGIDIKFTGRLPSGVVRVLKLASKYLLSPYWEKARLRNVLKEKIHNKFGNLNLRFSTQKINSSKYKNVYIFFPIQSYFGRMQRPQHIFNNLRTDSTLKIWVEPEMGEKKSKEESLYKLGKDTYLLKIKNINYSNFYNTGICSNEAQIIYNKINDILKSSMNLEQKKYFIYQSPFWTEMIDVVPNVIHVYDCMDLHGGFGSSSLEVEMLEKTLFSKLSKLIVSSDYLYKMVKKDYPQIVNENIKIIKNGCNISDFPFSSESKWDTRIIGYFGAIAEWFDAELIIEAAKLLPNFKFELIGQVLNESFQIDDLPSNIHLLGEIPYNNLPEKTKNWSCAIIPFKVTELIKATNPVKLYEYSALGLPVLSSPIPEVIGASIKSYIFSNPTEFIKNIEIAKKEDNPKVRSERRNFAKLNTWNERAKLLNEFYKAENK